MITFSPHFTSLIENHSMFDTQTENTRNRNEIFSRFWFVLEGLNPFNVEIIVRSEEFPNKIIIRKRVQKPELFLFLLKITIELHRLQQ